MPTTNTDCCRKLMFYKHAIKTGRGEIKTAPSTFYILTFFTARFVQIKTTINQTCVGVHV